MPELINKNKEQSFIENRRDLRELVRIDEISKNKINEELDKGKVVIIVFGKKLRRDGSLHYRGLQTLNKVEEIYKKVENKQNLYIILTGGKSSSYVLRNKEIRSEAHAMYEELKARGVNTNNILLEENSYDTTGNVIFSYPIVKSLNNNTIVLVAEEPMIERGYRIARKVFEKNII